MSHTVTTPIIVALDFAEQQQAMSVLEQLDPNLCRIKVGKEMFTRLGPDWVRLLIDKGFDVFLDLKFHDIPNTIQGAVSAAADLGVWMLNVHASGGPNMMAAAREALNDFGNDRPYLIAVTVLTSLTDADLAAIGLSMTTQQYAQHLAQQAQQAGLDGVVCSAQEASALRQLCGEEFILVTPGIRPAGSAVQDQKRITTPAEAIALGSHYLVIGRPITRAPQPGEALQQIAQSLSGAAE